MDYLYRFRGFESLLGKHKELEQQIIYFATPEQLNDPLEGYKDFFWHGDEIIWKNFLTHYLMSLTYELLLTLTNKETKNICLYLTPRELVPPLQILHNKICFSFFENHIIQKLNVWLATHEQPIRKETLIIYLRMINLFALEVILGNFRENGVIDKNNHFLIEPASNDLTALNNFMNNFPKPKFTKNEVYEIFINLEFKLIETLKNSDLKKQKILNYPSIYLNKIHQLTTPNLGVACFMDIKDDNVNPAIWGYYGENHRGFCLKFKIKEKDSKSFIELTAPTQTLNNEYSFYKIDYHPNEELYYPKVDFFHSMGRFNKTQLKWYLYHFYF